MPGTEVHYNMIIEINNTTLASQVSDAFTAAFPFLTLAFFEHPHEWGAASPLTEKIAPGVTMAALCPVLFPVVLEIHGWQTTGAVEQACGRLLGRAVQVFRREGAAWLQTTDTDNRTLNDQNDAGRNASQEWMDGTDERFNKQNPVQQ